MNRLSAGGILSAIILSGAAPAIAAQPLDIQRSGSVYHVAACNNAVVGLAMRCTARIVSDKDGKVIASAKPPVGGFGPSDLRSAYNIKANGKSSTIIAIVDAFGYTNAESDLGVYRSNFGLPECTTKNGCFKKLNQKGEEKNYPDQNIGWAQESALDLDMASAMCPGCTIYLVEGRTNSLKNLALAVKTAARLGAHVISNSYSGGEGKGTIPFEKYYTRKDIAITASTGDGGYGIGTPAAMSGVIAVGGTHLVRDGSDRGWTETVWRGAGSGCSKLFRKPIWQKDPGCANKMSADVSAVADPATGVAVYGPTGGGSGWLVFGGTSVSAPLIGGVFGANGGKVHYASSIYRHKGLLNDVTSGSNGTCDPNPAYFCNGEVGYDGPTGWGTPNGIGAFGD